MFGLTFVGVCLLLHAAYSAYEHHHILKNSTTIPHDIILQVIIGLLALNFGTIGRMKNTFRLSLNEGKEILPDKTYLQPIELSQAISVVSAGGVSGYEHLENRIDFLDIRRKRQQHMDWVSSTR